MKRVGLVFDASAAQAYPSIDVGEPITQVMENGAMFAVPILCLVEASRNGNADHLDLLVRHEAFRPVELPPNQWRQYAEMMDKLDAAAAAALLLATIWRCDILTGDPGRYASLGDDPPIILI